MKDKIKEAAEKLYPKAFNNNQITSTSHHELGVDYNKPEREAFIEGATSPEAEEYWRDKLKVQLPELRERFIKSAVPDFVSIESVNEVFDFFEPYLQSDEEMKLFLEWADNTYFHKQDVKGTWYKLLPNGYYDMSKIYKTSELLTKYRESKPE